MEKVKISEAHTLFENSRICDREVLKWIKFIRITKRTVYTISSTIVAM
jgi:hypothetical protein